MWLWWVMGATAVLLVTAAVHDRRRRSEFRAVPRDLSGTDRREALRLRRADLAAYNHEAVGYGGGFGIHCGGPCGVSTAAVVTAAVVVELSSIRDRVRKAGAVQHVCCRWFPRRH